MLSFKNCVRSSGIRRVTFCRWQSSLFQESPFNYGTLKDRLNKFSDAATGQDLKLNESVILDAIKSCRKLQQKLGQERNISQKSIENNTVNAILGDSKEGSVTGNEAEALLEKFVFSNDNVGINTAAYNKNEEIVRNYLLTKPVPNSERILQTVEKLRSKGKMVSDSNIQIALRVILNHQGVPPVENFQNAFKLVADTVGSEQYVESVKHTVISKYVPWYLGGFAGIEVVSGWVFDRFAVELTGISSVSTTGLKLMLGSYLFNVSLLGVTALLGYFNNNTLRVKWRSGVGMWHKYLHHKELRFYEIIFIHFEEMYDNNVGNYNVAQAGDPLIQSEGVKSLLNYKEEASNGRVEYEDMGLEVYEEKKRLLTFFRENLRAKRMQITEQTDTEQLFQEYWASNGENFQWVEPDQDPAEIALVARSRSLKYK